MNSDTGWEPFPAPRGDRQRLVRLSKRPLVQRYSRLVQRCLDMSPQEVAHRVGTLLSGRDLGSRSTPSAIAGARAEWIESLQQRFLFGPDDRAASVAYLGRTRSESADLVGKAAANLRHGGVKIFARMIPLNPESIDWQADPYSGRRLWPEMPLDEAGAVSWAQRAGVAPSPDVKAVWELNRHQFLPTLGCAFWFDNDEGHAAFAVALVDRWISQNPPGLGVNWSSRLEVALRAISWLWAMAFVLDWEGLDDGRRDRWVASLVAHYDFLRQNLSLYADRTNHLIGEAAALWMLATVVPGLPGAATEQRRTLEILRGEAERQITADGVSREQSVSYHCFVLDFYLQVIALARHHALALPAVIEARVVGMIEFLARLLNGGGDLPQIGDGDDGYAIPFPRPVTTRDRALSLLAVGATLFDRSEWLAAGAEAMDLPYWLLGRRVSSSARTVPCAMQSAILHDGGYAFLEATTAAGHQRQLIFDIGSLGYLPNAAHEHADALSILVRVNQTLVLADPGTGMYTGAPNIRNGFRGTASHNTITIDELDQADVLDTFKWMNPTTTELLGWSLAPGFDYVAAAHNGYQRLRSPVRHCREVLFVRPEYWIVVDHLTGRGQHRVARRFHFPPEIEVEQIDSNTFDAVSRTSGDGLRLIFPESAGAPLTVRLEDAPWSAHYGSWEPASCLVAETMSEPPMTLATVIVPIDAEGPTLILRDRTRSDVLYQAGVIADTKRYEDIVHAVPETTALSFVRRDEQGRPVRAFGDAKAEVV